MTNRIVKQRVIEKSAVFLCLKFSRITKKITMIDKYIGRLYDDPTSRNDRGDAMKKNLAIYDTDWVYGRRLAEYINEKMIPFGVQVMAFEKEEELAKYLEVMRPEYLLCTEDAAEGRNYEEMCGQLYYLSSAPPPEKDLHTISKYQSADRIVKKLMAGQFQEVRRGLQEKVLEMLDYSKETSDEELLRIVEVVISREGGSLTDAEQNQMTKEVFNSLRRMDVLQELLEDESVTEIMVNGARDLFIERGGKLTRYEGCFESERKLLDIAQQMAAESNRRINEACPITDTRLPCGSRVNIVLPPVALNGPVITIRKFAKESMTMERLIALGSLTEEVAEVLKNLVKAGYNIFISGGTGSGKTTFLNALSNYIPREERVVTIEDSAELQIRNIPNLVRLEVKNANVEGNHAVEIRDLIRASLRMRPDRIIVGEVRGEEAIDMLQAMNTGHDGSLSTGHANSCEDILSRLETMVLLASEIPILAVRKQIASAIDIVIQLGRLRDKSRKVLEISELCGCEGQEIRICPLYRFVESGEDENGRVLGTLEYTGERLQNTQKLRRAGLQLEGLSGGDY